VDNSTILRAVGQYGDEENGNGFIGCGDVRSLASNAKPRIITQLVRSLRGSNVHETKIRDLKYRIHDGSIESNTRSHFLKLLEEIFP
jgi:hypothetical protein